MPAELYPSRIVNLISSWTGDCVAHLSLQTAPLVDISFEGISIQCSVIASAFIKGTPKRSLKNDRNLVGVHFTKGPLNERQLVIGSHSGTIAPIKWMPFSVHN